MITVNGLPFQAFAKSEPDSVRSLLRAVWRVGEEAREPDLMRMLAERFPKARPRVGRAAVGRTVRRMFDQGQVIIVAEAPQGRGLTRIYRRVA